MNNKIFIPTLFKRSSRLIDSHIDRLLKKHSVARSQYRAMYYVYLYGEPTQKELVEIMDVKGSTLTLIVDVLEQKQWLVRISDPADKRVKRLRLTSAGKNLFEQIPDPAKELHKTILEGLSKEEALELEKLLGKVINNLN